jgi:hypothetical protein
MDSLDSLPHGLWVDAFLLAGPETAKGQLRGLIDGCLSIASALSIFAAVAFL